MSTNTINAKDPARIAVLPSHGPTNPGKEIGMNKPINTTAQCRKPEAAGVTSVASPPEGTAATELTAPEHQHSEAVILAAQWLADQNPAPSPAIPTLRSQFSLSASEACEAAAMARRYRILRRAHG